MHIRQATLQDATSLYNLYTDLCKDEDQDFGVKFPTKLSQDSWLSQTLRYMESGGEILVAEFDAKLVGYLKYRIEPRPIETPVFVSEMYVRPEKRAEATGKQLFDTARKDIKEWNAKNPELAVSHIELACRPSKRQMDRWMRKGWKPWMVFMVKEFD